MSLPTSSLKDGVTDLSFLIAEFFIGFLFQEKNSHVLTGFSRLSL